jgi:hypothetical protein
MGTPAKPVRELSEAEVKRADNGVDHYLGLMEQYRQVLQPGRPLE